MVSVNFPADTFMRALQTVEDSGDMEPLLRLFRDDAKLSTPARTTNAHGPDDVRAFWSRYLAGFKRIHSQFTRVMNGDTFAVLEWQSEGELPSGQPIRYRGVSLIEFENQQESQQQYKISRFCTYYDSAVFLTGGSKETRRAAET